MHFLLLLFKKHPTDRFGEYLLSPTIFGLKCDEKLEFSLLPSSSDFREMGKVMPVFFWRDKNVV